MMAAPDILHIFIRGSARNNKNRSYIFSIMKMVKWNCEAGDARVNARLSRANILYIRHTRLSVRAEASKWLQFTFPPPLFRPLSSHPFQFSEQTKTMDFAAAAAAATHRQVNTKSCTCRHIRRQSTESYLATTKQNKINIATGCWCIYVVDASMRFGGAHLGRYSVSHVCRRIDFYFWTLVQQTSATLFSILCLSPIPRLQAAPPIYRMFSGQSNKWIWCSASSATMFGYCERFTGGRAKEGGRRRRRKKSTKRQQKTNSQEMCAKRNVVELAKQKAVNKQEKCIDCAPSARQRSS